MGVAPGSLHFHDLDLDLSEIGGTLSWTPPVDLTGLTHFSAFFAEDAAGTNRRVLPSGSTLLLTQTSLNVAVSTPLLQFTHILMYANNLLGEGPPSSLEIVDRAVPLAF